MFTKGNKDDNPQQPVRPKAAAPPSILSTDLKVIGDVDCAGEIQIDGTVEGDIRSDVLVVGETAQVNGEIYADTVRVHGYVTGQIKARSVSLAKTAHVLGGILHESLAIEQGAFLEGHCRRIEGGTGNVKDSGSGVDRLNSGAKLKADRPEKDHTEKTPAEAAAE